MSDEKTVEYSGRDTTVSWDGGLCIHIGECGRAKGELFVAGRKPWCEPDKESREHVEEVIRRCPSGALSYEHADGTGAEQPAAQNSVHVVYNGPLYLRGDLAIDGAPDDAPGLKFRAALCRCGKSANKPFCDNSHLKAGFADYGAVGETGPGLDDTGGPLVVKPTTDGPLLLKGNVTISAATGRAAWSGTQTALCRCGESGNKPFCDGSHKKAGFKSG